MLPTKFQVNWPFISGAEKLDFQDGGHGGLLGFPIGMILAIINLQKKVKKKSRECHILRHQEEEETKKTKQTQIEHPDASYQVQVSWPFGSGEEAINRFSRWPPSRPSWFPIRTIFYL